VIQTEVYLSGRRWVSRLVIAAALSAVALGCTTAGKKEVAKSAIESLSPKERRDSIEATARLLDENPQLVDELYSVVRHHPATMHRFLENAAPDLKEPWLSKAVAEVIVGHPESLEQTLVVVTDAVAREPKARAAINRGLARRAGTMVDIATDDRDALGPVVGAMLAIVEKKPSARRNILTAVRQERRRILAVIKNDPELVKELAEEFLREAVKDKPALEKMLRAAGVIDDDGRSKAKAKY
jgi:hypothetical protein